MQTTHRGVVVVAIASQLAGCSLLFVDRAPDHVQPGQWADCTESRTWPVVDAVVGASFLISAVGIGATASDDPDNSVDEDTARVMAPMYGLMAVGMFYSAYVGFRETNKCTRIHEEAEARGVYGPYPYGYPPQPYPYPQPYPQPYPPPPPAPQPAPQPPGQTP